MQLELAFFDAQIHGSAKDDSSKQMSTADSAGVQSLGSQLYGEGARGNGRFSGVHGRVSLLCVDFDDTLTDGDTTSLLVEAAKAQVRLCRSVCGGSPCKMQSILQYFREFESSILVEDFSVTMGTRSFIDWCSFFAPKSAHSRGSIRRTLSMNGRCYRKIFLASGAR